MNHAGSFEQMQGVIGSVIWLWVDIERTVRKQTVDRQGVSASKSPPALSRMLDIWLQQTCSDAAASPFRTALAQRLCEQVREARQTRNGICHGLSGLEAANSERPGRLFWRYHGIETSRTWAEFQDHFAWLSKVSFALEILDLGDLSRHGRLVDTAENRGWWEAEFGIDLGRA